MENIELKTVPKEKLVFINPSLLSEFNFRKVFFNFDFLRVFCYEYLSANQRTGFYVITGIRRERVKCYY